jgi:hypothetical protein
MHLHPLTKEDLPTSNDNLKETMMATMMKKTTATPIMGMPGTMGTTPATSNHRDNGQTAAMRNSLQGRSEKQQQGEGMATMTPPLL